MPAESLIVVAAPSARPAQTAVTSPRASSRAKATNRRLTAARSAAIRCENVP